MKACLMVPLEYSGPICTEVIFMRISRCQHIYSSFINVGLYSPIGSSALKYEANVQHSIHSSGELKGALRGPTITLPGSSFPVRSHM